MKQEEIAESIDARCGELLEWCAENEVIFYKSDEVANGFQYEYHGKFYHKEQIIGLFKIDNPATVYIGENKK